MPETIATPIAPTITDHQSEAWPAALYAAHTLYIRSMDQHTSRIDSERLASEMQGSVYRLLFSYGLTINDAGIPTFAEPDIQPRERVVR